MLVCQNPNHDTEHLLWAQFLLVDFTDRIELVRLQWNIKSEWERASKNRLEFEIERAIEATTNTLNVNYNFLLLIIRPVKVIFSYLNFNFNNFNFNNFYSLSPLYKSWEDYVLFFNWYTKGCNLNCFWT